MRQTNKYYNMVQLYELTFIWIYANSQSLIPSIRVIETAVDNLFADSSIFSETEAAII